MLQAYTYEIEYRKPEDHGNADALLRFLSAVERTADEPGIYQVSYVNGSDIAEKAGSSAIVEYNDMQPRKVHINVQVYFTKQVELSSEQGCLLCGSRGDITPTCHKVMIGGLRAEYRGVSQTLRHTPHTRYTPPHSATHRHARQTRQTRHTRLNPPYSPHSPHSASLATLATLASLRHIPPNSATLATYRLTPPHSAKLRHTPPHSTTLRHTGQTRHTPPHSATLASLRHTPTHSDPLATQRRYVYVGHYRLTAESDSYWFVSEYIVRVILDVLKSANECLLTRKNQIHLPRNRKVGMWFTHVAIRW